MTKKTSHDERFLLTIGGSMWESNPPRKLPTPHAGFEDQRAHQHPSTPLFSSVNYNITGNE
jgi:hypothetical protein